MDDPGAPGASKKLALTLLTRRDCPLCDEFQAELARWDGGLRRYSLNIVDIDTDSDLMQCFGTRVPVLMHGETELCASHFKEESLNQLLPSM